MLQTGCLGASPSGREVPLFTLEKLAEEASKSRGFGDMVVLNIAD